MFVVFERYMQSALARLAICLCWNLHECDRQIVSLATNTLNQTFRLFKIYLWMDNFLLNEENTLPGYGVFFLLDILHLIAVKHYVSMSE